MKRVEIETKISVDAKIGEKSVDEYLRDIADICHERLEISTSQNEQCEMLYEDGNYEELYDKMESRISLLEGTLCRILDYLED